MPRKKEARLEAAINSETQSLVLVAQTDDVAIPTYLDGEWDAVPESCEEEEPD